jgi:hypothetical protein
LECLEGFTFFGQVVESMTEGQPKPLEGNQWVGVGLNDCPWIDSTTMPALFLEEHERSPVSAYDRFELVASDTVGDPKK